MRESGVGVLGRGAHGGSIEAHGGMQIAQTEELCEKFSLERVTKSAAVFDKVKLSWMNGQHLRAYGEEEMVAMVGGALQEKGLLKSTDTPFAKAFVALASGSLELVTDAEAELQSLLTFPVEETIASDACKDIIEDNFKEVVDALLALSDSGDLETAVKEGTMKVCAALHARFSLLFPRW